MQSTSFDAIVVGSGISGGWAAKELTEKGLRVLLLERGRNVEHIKDYVNATKAPWEYLHRGGRTIAMQEAYQVLKRDLLNEKNLAFWVNEKESPYTEVKRFDWFRGYQAGATSISKPTHGRVSPSIGRFATKTSRRGTTTWRGTRESPARAMGCPSYPTVNSKRRCRSTAAKS
jgi:choline dehydrogenase-like flavoprotein